MINEIKILNKTIVSDLPDNILLCELDLEYKLNKCKLTHKTSAYLFKSESYLMDALESAYLKTEMGELTSKELQIVYGIESVKALSSFHKECVDTVKQLKILFGNEYKDFKEIMENLINHRSLDNYE